MAVPIYFSWLYSGIMIVISGLLISGVASMPRLFGQVQNRSCNGSESGLSRANRDYQCEDAFSRSGVLTICSTSCSHQLNVAVVIYGGPEGANESRACHVGSPMPLDFGSVVIFAHFVACEHEFREIFRIRYALIDPPQPILRVAAI
jgi:hypothetical protein